MASARKVPVPVAGSRIWTKPSFGEIVRASAGVVGEWWKCQVRALLQHLTPGGRIGETIGEPELLVCRSS
jgi:hypothetical protein